jgi:hypothetical protein
MTADKPAALQAAASKLGIAEQTVLECLFADLTEVALPSARLLCAAF